MSHQTSLETGTSDAVEDSYLDVIHAPQNSRSGRRIQQKPLSGATKRLLDLSLASGVFIVFAPIILFCVFALKFSGGPVVFSQLRVGMGGKTFRVYKFRTMVPNAPQVLRQLLATSPELRAEYARDHKLKNDPRITRIGRFLRRTSLDELPQLWNVLKGDMSLVGPRPVEMFEMAKYGCHAHYYYAQRPGLTGIWQISGRSGVSYEQRVAMDTYYSRKRTLLMDVRIVFSTVKVVFLGRGAY